MHASAAAVARHPSPDIPMPRRLLLVVLLLSTIWAPAWGQAPTLRVAVASSLADAVREIATGFQAARAGVVVRLDVAASGELLEQLAQGAPWDVLVSADADTLTRGVERRLVQPDSAREFATNALVLIAPVASTLKLQRLTDLSQVDVQRIAMGRVASVPAGRQARQAIDASRLWPSVQRKIVPADSVRHALDLVQRGDVDAGFVYRTDAMSAGARVRVVQVLAGHTPVRHAAAVTAASRQAALAREFVQYLRSDAARAVLVRQGFGTL
jgi:molybdate transport system substrate-binding protein